MTFQEPTYEEYRTATTFAKVRYKWGLVVTILCWIALVILIIYMVVYSRELSANPIRYTMDKLYLKECRCVGFNSLDYYINETSITWQERVVIP